MAINLQSNVPKTGYTAPKINVPSTYNTTGLNTVGTPLIGMPTTQPKPKVVTPVVNASNAQNQVRKAQEVVNTSTQTPPMYDKITGELTDAGKAAGMTPMSGGKAITTPTPVTPPAPLTPEQTLANMPEPGFQEAYNLQTGTREDQSIGAELPQGYSKSNPITRTDVQNTISDTTTGTTYKQFSDGTYGRFDAQGNYSQATAGAFASAQQGKATNDTINSIINGTFKLPASQQAQITALQNTYNDAITQQQTVNANAQGGASLMANMSGLVGSASGAGIVQATVENGIKKVASLQSELAGKVAEMTVAFEKDDISALQTSYSQYLNAQDNIQTEINNTQARVKAQQDKEEVIRKDNAVAQIYDSGITDPIDIMQALSDKGIYLTSTEIGTTLSNIDKAMVDAQKSQQDVLNSAQSMGDYRTAEAVMKLDPRSPTFKTDLAKLQGGMRAKATQAEKDESVINNTYNTFNKSKGSDNYVDPYEYLRMRAESTLSPSEFDNRFGHFINPASAEIVGFKTTANNMTAEEIKQSIRPMTTTPEYKAMKPAAQKDYILSQGGDPADYGL